jgi:hypothetical protein
MGGGRRAGNGEISKKNMEKKKKIALRMATGIASGFIKARKNEG